MKSDRIVPIVTTDKLASVKAFYQRHFNFKVSFENDSYLGLKIDKEGSAEIAFMTSCEKQPPYSGGVTYCLETTDVDAEHDRLTKEGLQVVMPLADYPWGDRAFAVNDPVGVSLYIYRPGEPSEELKQYIKE